MNSNPDPNRPSSFRNWVSMSGLLITGSSFFAFILLWVFDLLAKEHSPYFGILTYIVCPSVLTLGLALFFLGWLLHRRRLAQVATGKAVQPPLVIDLGSERDRKRLVIFALGSVAFLLLTAIGSYQTYHVTKSVRFCGETCHKLMEPEYVAYKRSAHARVECVECHVAPGATGFVEAKLGGLQQVYKTLTNGYQKPLDVRDKVGITNDTCKHCHWPQKYHGNIERTFSHFLTDDENTPYTVRLSLNVGGADATQGPVGGIHWHMHLSTKVEFIALDPEQQKIPWVRMTDADGKVTEFRRPDFKDDISKYKLHTMGCMDCHNRPAHQFPAPTDAVDKALTLGQIDRSLPAIKREAVLALTQKDMATTEEATRKIADRLRKKYPASVQLDSTIAAVQEIYRLNFFPEMNTDWKLRPNNIGHKDSPGCFRCHDGEHVSGDRTLKIKTNECNACHDILAEGRGAQLAEVAPKGRPFRHPEEGWEDLSCSDCHDGTVGPDK